MSAIGVLSLTQRFEIIDCSQCHIQFGLAEDVLGRYRTSGATFYCPAGHGQCYRETEAQRLRKELDKAKKDQQWYADRLKDERSARESTERRLVARKGANTRLRNRIKNGVCPCCTRTFMNLQQHIKTKHPDFQADDAA